MTGPAIRVRGPVSRWDAPLGPAPTLGRGISADGVDDVSQSLSTGSLERPGLVRILVAYS